VVGVGAAFGCASPVAPHGAWVTHSEHHALVQCNASDSDELPVRWRLTCRGTRWHGHVGNCTGLAASLAAAAQESQSRKLVTHLRFCRAILLNRRCDVGLRPRRYACAVAQDAACYHRCIA